MLLINEIRLPLGQPQEAAVPAALQTLRVSASAVAHAAIHKVSVDARRGAPVLVYSVAVSLKDAAAELRYKGRGKHVQVIEPPIFKSQKGTQALPGQIIVCGCGPAGLFAALELAEAGYAPLLLERGPQMDHRRKAVDAFEQGGALLPNANIQFGEGGAGTFSDGKLVTRIKDPLSARVTQRLLDAGAPEEIAWRAKPHIGTDLLRGVFVALRQRLIELGGQVMFDTTLTALHHKDGRLCSISTTAGDMPCGVLVLAVGHSARDTFDALAKAGLELQTKPFSVGMRAEHLQAEIEKGLYHEAAGHPALPHGEYQLSTHVGGRGVYTFCMCPGGSVVAAASEEGGVVTNGMSLHARDGANANAAVVVGVNGADFDGAPFKAIAFQRELERAAYQVGGRNYAAPAQTLDSFLEKGNELRLRRVQPTYSRGVVAADIGALLPDELGEALRAGLRAFGRKLPGYDAPDTVLTGLETRTSSSVRLPRDENYQSVQVQGLYPCGEGAGYAGGIMSAAVDGVRVASAIIGKYAPPQ